MSLAAFFTGCFSRAQAQPTDDDEALVCCTSMSPFIADASCKQGTCPEQRPMQGMPAPSCSLQQQAAEAGCGSVGSTTLFAWELNMGSSASSSARPSFDSDILRAEFTHASQFSASSVADFGSVAICTEASTTGQGLEHDAALLRGLMGLHQASGAMLVGDTPASAAKRMLSKQRACKSQWQSQQAASESWHSRPLLLQPTYA